MRLAALALLVLAQPAFAEIHEVKMLNRGDSGPMVYEPAFLQIAPGDTVRFLSSQPGHNAASIDGMLPEGAQAFRSRLNQDFDLTLDVPGHYGIKCSPHYAMGMVMLIRVGDAPAVHLPDDLPKRARERLDAIIAAHP